VGSISFTIPGAPITKLRPRFSRTKRSVRTYDSQSAEKETVRWQLRSRMVGVELIVGAVEAEFVFYMPIPKSWSKRKKEASVGKPHVVKIDLDNACKFYFDCMNGIVYVDDCQVHSMTAKKIYDSNPRAEITIRW